ncbi:MAG: prolipoprotein diacylglyceryl transferase [Acidobacteria bacterium]|nr:prolipoprotein diacylglyceryl transferase [Acidobacteriota bacterium]
MIEICFLTAFAVCLGALYSWAFRALPGERWQFLAAAPGRRGESGWAGVNFTFYGFFSATAYAVSTGVFLLLMASVGAPLTMSLLVVALTLLVCAPASQWIAWAVEGKRYGFTIGGASFVGFFVVPLVIALLNATLGPRLAFELPLTPSLAAISIAYVLGEGLGRLACISFGCCYGKPVSETRGWVRWVSERCPFVFEGKTKKIAFASQLEGVRVAPVQAMTATLYGVLAVAATGLFFLGRYAWVLPLALGTAQVWRTYSETFRADYRGDSKITVYQWMAAFTTLAALVAPFGLPSSVIQPDLAEGLRVVWRAETILFLQGIWLALFFYMGRSMQTGAQLHFHVHVDRI